MPPIIEHVSSNVPGKGPQRYPIQVLGFAGVMPLAYAGERLSTPFREWREDRE